MALVRPNFLVLLALAPMVDARPGQAFYLDGAKLQGQCAAMSRDGSYRVADGLVGGYVAGIVDQVLATPGGKRAFCIPAKADLREVRDAVCRSVAKHVERRKDGAASLVRLALTEAFPCR